MEQKWQTLDIKALETELKTDLAEGLSIREARARLEKEKRRDGGERYSLFVPRKSNQFRSMLSFFTTPAVLALLMMSVLAAIFGAHITGIIVFMIALTGAVIGGIVSAYSQKVIDSMKEYASPMVKVKRGGNRFFTDGRNAVAGGYSSNYVGHGMRSFTMINCCLAVYRSFRASAHTGVGIP